MGDARNGPRPESPRLPLHRSLVREGQRLIPVQAPRLGFVRRGWVHKPRACPSSSSPFFGSHSTVAVIISARETEQTGQAEQTDEAEEPCHLPSRKGGCTPPPPDPTLGQQLAPSFWRFACGCRNPYLGRALSPVVVVRTSRRSDHGSTDQPLNRNPSPNARKQTRLVSAGGACAPMAQCIAGKGPAYRTIELWTAVQLPREVT